MARSDLKGLRVLVTRPAHQAETLCRLIEAAGGRPVPFPTLAIAPPDDPEQARRVLARLANYDIIVFVSANAALFGFELLDAPFPEGPKVAAVGRGTAAQLERLGRPADLVPEGGGDSEALLAMPELDNPDGCRVLIVRGEGGRERLAAGLRERGAVIEYAEVYRRALPDPVPKPDIAALDILTATSFEALENLEQMAGADRIERLRTLPLAVFHPRIAEKARERGYRGPFLVAREPGDEALVSAINAWAQTKLQD